MDETRPTPTEGSFEAGLERLEAIVKQLEHGELELERALDLFEEGTSLNRDLGRKLEAAEGRIEILLRERDGGTKTEPFVSPSETPATDD